MTTNTAKEIKRSSSSGTGGVAGNKLVVLGFSGGLDTSYCVKYLTEDKGYEVHSVIVNTGGFSKDELLQIEKDRKSVV